MGAFCIPHRVWRICVGLSLPESLSETCITASLFTPLVLMPFCLLALGPSFVGPLDHTVLCTVDFAAPALAMCVCVCVRARARTCALPWDHPPSAFAAVVATVCVCVCVQGGMPY